MPKEEQEDGRFSRAETDAQRFVSGHGFSHAERGSRKTGASAAPKRVRNALYQGTTSVVPKEGEKRRGLQPPRERSIKPDGRLRKQE
jgi:hypothetical protein